MAWLARVDPMTLLMPMRQHWLGGEAASVKVQQNSSPSGIGLMSKMENMIARIVALGFTSVETFLVLLRVERQSPEFPATILADMHCGSQLKSICTAATFPAPSDSWTQISDDPPGVATPDPTSISSAVSERGVPTKTVVATRAQSVRRKTRKEDGMVLDSYHAATRAVNPVRLASGT